LGRERRAERPAGVSALSLRALNRATLARQLLLERHSLPVTDAVHRLGGLQAQEPKHPFVGLWTRLDGFRPEELHDALGAAAIVRGTLLRGTVHLARADDHAALWPALAAMLAKSAERFADQLAGVPVADVVAAGRELLAEGPMTFGDLRPALQERFPDSHDRALGYVVMGLPLAMVPTDGRWGFAADSRFGLVSHPLKEPDPAALVRRHLAAFGPATPADVQAWSGVTGAKATLAALGDDLVTLRDESGRTLFDLPDAPLPDPDTPAPARYLPEFDNLVLAHKDRTRLVADEHRGRITTKNLRVNATILVDGMVAGTWTGAVKRGEATLRVKPFAWLPRATQTELEREGEALMRFLEPDVRAWAVTVDSPS